MGIEVTIAIIAATITVISTVLTLLASGPDIDASGRATEEESGLLSFRYIFGRARVRGMPVWTRDARPDKDHTDLHQAIILGEGPMEEIEKVWVGAREVSFNRTVNSTTGIATLTGTGEWSGRFWAYEHFKADGTQLLSNDPAISLDYEVQDKGFKKGATPIQWTDQHKLNGISWVHFHARSVVGKRAKPKTQDQKVWKRYPRELEFQVKGLKITWPGQTTPIWTDNPANWLYWFWKNRVGMEDADINITAYEAARSKCDESITYTAAQIPDTWKDAGYTRTTNRYSCNGVYLETDDTETIERQIVRSMAGRVVDYNGETYMFAGARRTPVATLTAPEDLVERFATFSPGVSLQQRGNHFQMQLSQSAQDDYTPEPLADYVDTYAFERDQHWYDTDFGQARFINDKIQGARILSIMAREVARSTASYGYRVTPGDNFERYTWKPSDHLLLVDPDLGIQPGASQEVVIDKISYDTDGSLIVEVTEYDPITHDDTLVLPPLSARTIDWGVLGDIPEPTGVSVGVRLRQQPDGPTIVLLHVLWIDINPAIVAETQFRVREKDPSDQIGVPDTDDAEDERFFTFSTDDSPPWSIPLGATTLAPGDTAVWQMRHVAPDGSYSEWTTLAELLLEGDAIAPGDPASATITPLPSAWHVEWDYPSDSDYSYTEIEAREAGVGAAFAVVADTDGSGHTQPAESEEMYEVRIRHVDLSGNQSNYSSVLSVTTLTAIAGIINTYRNQTTGEVTFVYSDFNWSTLVADTGSTDTQHRTTGLEPDSYHHYRVSAINSVGTGPPSNDDGEPTDDVTP